MEYYKSSIRIGFIIKFIPTNITKSVLREICSPFGEIFSIMKSEKYNYVNFSMIRFPPHTVICALAEYGIIAELTQKSQEMYKNLGQSEIATNMKKCTHCNNVAMKMCAKCSDPYCSIVCQINNWPHHRYICYQMPPLIDLKPNSNEQPDVSKCDTSEQSSSFHSLLSDDDVLANFATSTTIECKPSDTDREPPVLEMPFTIDLLPTGTNVPVVVLDNSFLELGMFTACRQEDAWKLEMFMIYLQKYGKNNDVPYEPVSSEYCLAKFPEDGRWYRGKVVQCLKNDRFLINYLDYGNESILKAENIRRYPMEVTEPCKTSRCMLVDCPLEIPYNVAQRLGEIFTLNKHIILPEVQYHDYDVVAVKDDKIVRALRDAKL